MADYDVIIVGAGISGAIMALELGKQNKRVLVLDAGPADPNSRKDFQDQFLRSVIKLPECPYPPYEDDPAQQNAPRANSHMLFKWPGYKNPDRKGQIDKFNATSHLTVSPASEIPFLSTYERVVGGTTWHWLGTCLRLLPNDFRMNSMYGRGIDWPIGYDDLVEDYGRAEHEIGVSASVDEQEKLGIAFPPGYSYPMPRIAPTYSDVQLDAWMAGLKLSWLNNQMPRMTNTPQARNSIFHDGRRACAGNTSCIPMCPIQAKYDATITLQKAINTNYVIVQAQSVVKKVNVDAETHKVTSVDVVRYDSTAGGTHKCETLTATAFVIAAHAIETPRLLLNSKSDTTPKGVANKSGQVGHNLMDHIVYLGWGLSPEPVYPNRGPRSSGGIETLRDGPFRKDFAAFRVDVGNEGWGWADGDPNTITNDFIDGTNNSGTNPDGATLCGDALVKELNDRLTRMVRFCYLVEQLPCHKNKIALSGTENDGLGIPRPEITYNLDDYTFAGLASAAKATSVIFEKCGITNYTRLRDYAHDGNGYPTAVDSSGTPYNVYGAGHIAGTYRMGSNPDESVVNDRLQSHDHSNLFLLGSGVFPTIATGNPTLTIAALTYRASRELLKQL
ncbi:GMC family oxidoreductase [Rhizobium sp. KVB221]|uniref:GMC family oxidoreductase n=1 Tax=Rhizobium setariae TaxID=2801340 RepID=A0A936YTG4_9HYPH|nr:GMC family oxidoreductase [Rhizobium setariae]MBL0374597.1 GMC family oxidoreductase [Rhizobium setariae]